MKLIEEVRSMHCRPPLPKEKLQSCLRRAAAAGEIHAVALLLKLAAEVNGYGPLHRPPIIDACERSFVSQDVIGLLLEHGAVQSAGLVKAASRDRTALIQQLLSRGASPHGALLEAAVGAYMDIFRLLLVAGADVNKSIGANSPLASAIGLERTNMFKLLIHHGADLYSAGTVEECVRQARETGLESMLELLQSHGVDTSCSG